MKKLILLIFVITVIINNSNAQQERSIAFGLKVGTNYSDVYEQKGVEFNTEGKLGVVGGAFFAVCVGEYICIQPELLFSQKGFRATGKIQGNAYKINRTSNYIDMPLFIGIKPNEFVTVVVGPQYSYLLKQKDVFSKDVLTFEQPSEFNNDKIRTNVFSIVGGVDINLQKFVIGVRLGWDVQNNNADASSSTPHYKNAWAQATLGFKIF